MSGLIDWLPLLHSTVNNSSIQFGMETDLLCLQFNYGSIAF